MSFLDPVNCSCNQFTETTSGGVKAGGSASVSDTVVRGGVVLGGSALVAVPSQDGDGYIFVYPLDAQYDGTSGEVDDVASGLDGTAGGLEYPTLDDGVYCLGSNNFADNEYISLPADNLSGNSFSVSAWVKINGYYRERVWYSRGFNTVGGDQWSIRFGHSVINNVWASVQTADGEFHCFSSGTMQRERWYHVACSFDGSSLKVYINGVLGGTTAVTGSLVALGNTSYIARYNNGIGLNDGNLQELRMVPDAKPAAWFLAEYENFCASGWYLVSPTETISPFSTYNELAAGGVVVAGVAVEEYVEAPSTITLTSNFTSDFDGWNAFRWNWLSTGGQSGGYVRSFDADNNSTKTLTRTVEIASGGGTISFYFQRQGEFIPGFAYYPRLSSNIDGTIWGTTGNPNSWTLAGPFALSAGTHNLNFNCGYQDSSQWRIGIDTITITNVVP
ncbi:LamG domain-containing protein [Bremerella sp. P1]|uniref:LamG domain-containing protein n=1 Tax=Bremerella sp. P1 TaxID=3026424 RepID=UPI002367502D|nr:LamG domain-containing protein [Bremerella sp. P1]WDI41817.1 LamG domain-containing protein [Bremerella sp. P1]